MEYKSAKELKPKEYIIDPDSEEVFQIITIKPGNKPRIMYRELKNNKISEIIVSSHKQFLLAEIEEFSYQLNYYTDNNLYIMDYNTYEELIFDGSVLGDNLKDLKSEFDSGKSIELKVQNIGMNSILMGFNVVKEVILDVKKPTEPKKSEKQSDIKKERKIAPVKKVKENISDPPDPKKISEIPTKSIKIKKEEINKETAKVTTKVTEKTFNYKEFKGLGEKTFKILVDEFKISSLSDLVNADINELKKIPKVSEKKINDWKTQAKKLIEK